jgi:uncharacterized protein YpmB
MIKRFYIAVGFILLAALFYNLKLTQTSEVSLYVGSNKCKMCHTTAKQGEQFRIWADSKHALAYKNLASETGKQKAKKLAVNDPQKSEKCLICHTTAYGKEKLWDKSYSIEEGVGCEACHGPGSIYKKISIMKNRELALKNGMILGNKNSCLTCHRKDNPEHNPVFNYEKSWEQIKHPIP